VCFLLRLRRAAQLLADTTGAAAWYLSVTCVHPTAAIAASANKIALQSRCVMRAPLPYLVIEPPCGFRHDYTRGAGSGPTGRRGPHGLCGPRRSRYQPSAKADKTLLKCNFTP